VDLAFQAGGSEREDEVDELRVGRDEEPRASLDTRGRGGDAEIAGGAAFEAPQAVGVAHRLIENGGRIGSDQEARHDLERDELDRRSGERLVVEQHADFDDCAGAWLGRVGNLMPGDVGRSAGLRLARIRRSWRDLRGGSRSGRSRFGDGVAAVRDRLPAEPCPCGEEREQRDGGERARLHAPRLGQCARSAQGRRSHR
jgi:hypothetical protein